ncbi:MAG TPA: ATP-binding cassette domain-containing protein [Syntrophomonadaceae bacterium]|nr:ATP-binding cassette domain-containing protein [Syntrophomonadaceae bacterium]
MLLEGRNIGFHYGKGNWVLRGINIEMNPGEIIGLSGPSGCGKTTLGRILAGYERPQEGHVRLNGAPLPREGYNPVQLVFQHPEKAVNGKWNIQHILNEGWQPDQDLFVSLGIEPGWMKRWPNELSGGELQRICVARALGPQTNFLIADEMTTMLDAITQAQIWQVLRGVAEKRQIGVLVVSHEEHLIRRLCHRAIHLKSNV